MSRKIEKTLPKRVADQLVSEITANRFGGDTLPSQEELSIAYDVSRTVMREAISMLVANGVVEVKTKIGMKVRPHKEWHLFNEEVLGWRFNAPADSVFLSDLTDFRALIEPRAAALAAKMATPEQIKAIRGAYQNMVLSTQGIVNYEESDEAFHTLILDACANQFLQQMGIVVKTALHTVNNIVGMLPKAHELSLPIHEQVLRAIEAHDAMMAEATMRQLVEHSAADLKETLTRKT